MRRAYLGAGLVVVALAVGAAPATYADDAPTKVSLVIQIDKSKVDLAGHHLELKASRDLSKVAVKVFGDSGNVIADETHDLGPAPAGTPVVVTWNPGSDEAVVRIEVFAYDVDGYYKGIAITPWSVSIPHEEVNFKTDSAVIEASERPKLEASFQKVSEAVAKHPEIRGVTLFIAGHTDTVGEASYNLRLSRMRAQSIARWFRARGLRIAIASEGFGEYALLVKTPDNTDEPRNRRVDYILSVDEPGFKVSGFRPAWTRVP